MVGTEPLLGHLPCGGSSLYMFVLTSRQSERYSPGRLAFTKGIFEGVRRRTVCLLVQKCKFDRLLASEQPISYSISPPAKLDTQLVWKRAKKKTTVCNSGVP